METQIGPYELVRDFMKKNKHRSIITKEVTNATGVHNSRLFLKRLFDERLVTRTLKGRSKGNGYRWQWNLDTK